MNEFQTPDTLAYLILGLVVSLGTIGVYIGSLLSKYRNLQKDEAAIHEVRD